MAVKTLEKNHAIAPVYPKLPLSESWIKARGILKGKKAVNVLCYQKQIRKEWEKRSRSFKRAARV